jgi:hypothetical protein
MICKAHSTECAALGMEGHISIPRATILLAMSRSWTTLANESDRYEAILKEECK